MIIEGRKCGACSPKSGWRRSQSDAKLSPMSRCEGLTARLSSLLMMFPSLEAFIESRFAIGDLYHNRGPDRLALSMPILIIETGLTTHLPCMPDLAI